MQQDSRIAIVDLAADVKRVQNAGMQVQGGFIVGFDNDSPSTFQRLVDFIQNTGISHCNGGHFTSAGWDKTL